MVWAVPSLEYIRRNSGTFQPVRIEYANASARAFLWAIERHCGQVGGERRTFRRGASRGFIRALRAELSRACQVSRFGGCVRESGIRGVARAAWPGRRPRGF